VTRKWLIALVPAILIVALLGYMAGRDVIPQSVQDNFANAASGPDISGLPDDNLAGALPEAPTNLQPAEAVPANAATPAATDADAAPADANDDQPDASSDARDQADAEAQARREIAATIRRATLAALDSGEPTHWHKDGLQGDIVVSVAQDDGQDGSCRTVAATMGTADDQKQSGDHVWCRSADGDGWTPQ
jgi:hypothetical protein